MMFDLHSKGAFFFYAWMKDYHDKMNYAQLMVKRTIVLNFGLSLVFLVFTVSEYILLQMNKISKL